MASIKKAPERMTSKQRVLNTFAYQKTDRVPIDFSANRAIRLRVCRALGIPDGNLDQLSDALGADYRMVSVRYNGPLLYPEIDGCKVDREYGFYTRWVQNESGGYHDFCHFPLQGADEDTIRRFPFPSPDHYDYELAVEEAKAHKEKALYAGSAGFADIINSIGRVMGMEDTLVNLLTEDEATLELIDRKCKMELGILERLFAKAKGLVDFLWIGEDLGTQIAPMISLDLYRRVLRPQHQKYIDLADAYHLPVLMHTCGSSSWAYEDFIEMGIQAVDTLQPEAANMSPAYLKERFGGRLSFHGCISTAGKLAYGTPGEVREEVRRTLEIMMPGGGYQLAPTHLIQDNTPTENVIAMYQAAHDFGRY